MVFCVNNVKMFAPCVRMQSQPSAVQDANTFISRHRVQDNEKGDIHGIYGVHIHRAALQT